jgi:hypothetical protein
MEWGGMLVVMFLVNALIACCIGSRFGRTCFSLFTLAAVPLCINFPFGKDFFPSKRQCWDYSAATTLMSTFRVFGLLAVVFVAPRVDDPYPFKMQVMYVIALATFLKLWLFRRFWQWDRKQRRRWRKVGKIEEAKRERRELHMMAKEDRLWQRRIAAYAHKIAEQAAIAAEGFAKFGIDQIQANFGPKHVQKKFLGVTIHDDDSDDESSSPRTSPSSSPGTSRMIRVPKN